MYKFLEEPTDIIFRTASLFRVEAEVPPKQWYVHKKLHSNTAQNLKCQTSEQFWK
jgi:hypothetical protein